MTLSQDFRPLQNRLLVKRLDAEAKAKGGILIPGNATEKPVEGEVIAVGAGKRGEDGIFRPLDVKKGDRIIFRKWSGTEIQLNGDELIVMNESEIMGIVENAVGTTKAA